MKNIFTSNTFITQIVLVLSILLTFYGIFNYGIDIQSVFLIILGYFLYVCLGIVVTFHRYHTHQSYKLPKTFDRIFSFFGCMSNTGSTIVWTAIHLKHHLYSDKQGDPHSPWITGWKVFLLSYPIDPTIKWRLKHLISDPYHRFLHRYYYLLMIGWSFLLYLIGGLYLMIFLHLAPIILSAIMSNVVNYVGHKDSWLGSYRSYNLSDKSTNNWIWAIPTWGESLHNNHHRFPKSTTTSQYWWEIDISGYIIKLIKSN
jgi:fatty-acid desaturase